MAETLDAGVRVSATLREDRSRRNVSKSENAATPVTPPTRFISSTYSTPGSTFGQEQDAIVIELNPRYLKAGLEGESSPQCCYNFTPSKTRRHGDHRQYLPNYRQPRETLETWGDGYELWKNDTKTVDLRVLADRLERAVREIYNNHLLVDAGNARLVLVVPSLLPHPVLAATLKSLFERWQYPSIALLPTPASTLIAAGLRSGLVVDIDWEETVVTVLYEYREVRTCRTTRAMKSLTKNVAKWMKESLQPEDRFDLQIVEDVLRRAGECCTIDSVVAVESSTPDFENIDIDWPTDDFTRSISFSRRGIQTVMLETMLGNSEEKYPDDEELPIHQVMYNALQAVLPDVRGLCISRIIFTGAGSTNQRLVSEVLKSFTRLVESRGWARGQGGKSRTKREGVAEVPQDTTKTEAPKQNVTAPSNSLLIEERYLREKAKHSQPVVHGIVRSVDSMGPWTGASLITALRVKSFVEIQRDRFLAHGLGGANRELDISVVPQQGRTSLATRTKAGERISWTLSGWG